MPARQKAEFLFEIGTACAFLALFGVDGVISRCHGLWAAMAYAMWRDGAAIAVG